MCLGPCASAPARQALHWLRLMLKHQPIPEHRMAHRKRHGAFQATTPVVFLLAAALEGWSLLDHQTQICYRLRRIWQTTQL